MTTKPQINRSADKKWKRIFKLAEEVGWVEWSNPILKRKFIQNSKKFWKLMNNQKSYNKLSHGGNIPDAQQEAVSKPTKTPAVGSGDILGG